MNKYMCIGRLGFDPDIISGGCRLKLAVDTFNGKEVKVVWLRVLVFGASGNNVLAHKKKGDRVLIEGRLDYTTGEKPELIVITDNVTFL